MDEHQIWIRSQTVKNVLQGAEAAGYEIEALLGENDIDPQLLRKRNASIPLSKYAALITYLKQIMNDEMVGLAHLPQQQGTNRLTSLLCVNAETLGEAMDRYIEFRNLLNNSFTTRLVDKGHQVEYVVNRIKDQPLAVDFAIDIALMNFHRFMGWLINEGIVLNFIKLDYEGQKQANYKVMFNGSSVLFNEGNNSLLFDRRYLDRRVVQNEASLMDYLQSLPLHFHVDIDAGGELSITVQDLILDYMSKNNHALPEMHYVAEALDLHPQTFRRRLRSEGTCFYDIKTQVRRDIAMHNLRHSDRSIEEVGFKTGYTDVGSFIRAFKAWTGLTPLNFRKSLRR